MDKLLEWLAEYWWMVPGIIVPIFSIIAKATPTETDNKVLGVVLKIVDVLAMNTKPTTVNKSLKLKSLIPFLLLPVLALAATGCALADLSPDDQAVAVAEEVTDAYLGVRGEYQQLVAELPADKAEWLRTNVAPVLDEGRDALVMLRDAVSIYKRTQVRPDDWDGLLARARSLVASAWAKINQLTGDDAS